LVQIMSKRAMVLCGLLVSVGAYGCGDDGNGPSGGASNGGSNTGAGNTGGAGASGDGGGFVTGCNPACVAPQFCSEAGECIDEGTCLTDGDCAEPGTVCDEKTQACVPGGGCEDLQAVIEPVPPNLLVVLDRSCSMTADIGGGVTKWDASVAALNTLTTTYAGDIRFGLSLFPDIVAPSCAQDAIAIPVAPAQETAIQTLLTAALVGSDPNFPDGPCVTNIDTAMEQAAAAPELLDTTRDNYVALITDGKQAGCNLAGGDAGTLTIIGDMFTAGIPTFVIGFGSGIDPAQMDAFAIAGGVPNSGPSYYDAADQASLEAVLEAIATQAISCTFQLDTVPPNPDQIFVFFDGVAVPEDPTMMNGWFYDPVNNQIVFYGEACDLLKSGEVVDVDVILGCEIPD
jgi:hypothetical protein